MRVAGSNRDERGDFSVELEGTLPLVAARMGSFVIRNGRQVFGLGLGESQPRGLVPAGGKTCVVVRERGPLYGEPCRRD